MLKNVPKLPQNRYKLNRFQLRFTNSRKGILFFHGDDDDDDDDDNDDNDNDHDVDNDQSHLTFNRFFFFTYARKIYSSALVVV